MKKIITAIGLMTGTSCDGIDISIIKSDGEDYFKSVVDDFYPFKQNTRQEIKDLRLYRENNGTAFTVKTQKKDVSCGKVASLRDILYL